MTRRPPKLSSITRTRLDVIRLGLLSQWSFPMYPFPPDQGMAHVSTWRITLQVAVLVLGLGGTRWYLMRRTRMPMATDILLWFTAGLILSALITASFVREEYSIPLHTFYLTVIWVGVVIGTAASLVKLISFRKQVDALAVLFAMSTPIWLVLWFCMHGLGNAHEPSLRTACMNKLKQISHAILDYREVHGSLPFRVHSEPEYSWRVEMLPYLEFESLHSRYDFSQPWDGPANVVVRNNRPPLFACPSMVEGSPEIKTQTAYSIPCGPGTICPENRPVALQEITDGRSQTLLVVEACGQGIIWTEPRDVDTTRLEVGVNMPGMKVRRSEGMLSSYHPNVACVAFADGSVRSLAAQTRPDVLKALLSPTGGEKLSAHDF